MAVTYDDLVIDLLGHASMHIETPDGRHVYIDPWSEMLTGEEPTATLIVSTHDDYDHYDPEAITALADDETAVVTFAGIDTADLGLATTPLAVGDSVTVDDIEITAVPAYNDPDGEHVGDDGTPFHQQGEVMGVVLTIGETTVYYPSDTDFLDELADVRADVFIPPIGGHYTMGRREAARFTESVDPDLVLPVHYDTFEAIETDVEAFVADVEERGYRAEIL
ncbi:MBL fold metallo-hydrolase [Halorarius litoreus]|uniref:MBL fold metallo-hydrolase n=1 Tax=Halorarius litoreus TaxID=2962676 RepID=UPI0020CDF442|nr:MBL fold metallo-hydrolase [Halorarius litoreus]